MQTYSTKSIKPVPSSLNQLNKINNKLSMLRRASDDGRHGVYRVFSTTELLVACGLRSKLMTGGGAGHVGRSLGTWSKGTGM